MLDLLCTLLLAVQPELADYEGARYVRWACRHLQVRAQPHRPGAAPSMADLQLAASAVMKASHDPALLTLFRPRLPGQPILRAARWGAPAPSGQCTATARPCCAASTSARRAPRARNRSPHARRVASPLVPRPRRHSLRGALSNLCHRLWPALLAVWQLHWLARAGLPGTPGREPVQFNFKQPSTALLLPPPALPCAFV